MAKVLIIDDDPIVRHILTTLLNEFGFEISEAASGSEGIEALTESLATKPIDLVFLDFMLDTSNSTPTLEAIQGQFSPGPKVCLISSYSATEIEEKQEYIHPDYFLQKPFRKNDLQQALSALGFLKD